MKRYVGIERDEAFALMKPGRRAELREIGTANLGAVHSPIDEGLFVGFLSDAVLWAMMELWHGSAAQAESR